MRFALISATLYRQSAANASCDRGFIHLTLPSWTQARITTELTLLNTTLTLLVMPGAIAGVATVTKTAIHAYSIRS
jgi:hypothetical protein